MALATLGVAFFILPLLRLLLRAPWKDAARSLTEPDTLQALKLSLVASLSATGIALVLGVPMAWIYARVEFPGRALLRALTTLPMVLPPVVGGIALLLAFGRRGLFGSWLDSTFGITLPFTTAGVVMAEAFVAMPFLILTREGGGGPVCFRGLAVTRRLPGPWAQAAGGCSHGSHCPSSLHHYSPERCSAGPERSESSVLRSPSPVTSQASRRRCRSPFTFFLSPTRKHRSS